MPISTTPGENGATTVPTISGRGFWNGLAEDADAELERRGAREGDLEAVVREIDVVGRIALPDRQDHVDRLGEHLVAVLLEDAERLGVGGERAGADAEDEAALRQMVEHRRVHGDQHRMHVRRDWWCRSRA